MIIAIVIGAILGIGLGHSLVGAIIGGSLGWWAHHLLTGAGRGLGYSIGGARQQFQDSTFAVMGALCKADGQVTDDEIRTAEKLFDKLHMNQQQRATAKAAFKRGKAPEFDLDAEVAAFVKATRGNRALCRMFLQVQLSAIAADGVLHTAERDMLMRVARGLGLSEAEVARLEAMLGGASRRGGVSPEQAVNNAYDVLGVSSGTGDSEIKKAYRRLMSENHPDKLAAKGLPESMRQMAEEKTREIAGAYDTIKQARGFN